MNVEQVVELLGLKVVAGRGNLARAITGGYTADLLSCVMARAKRGNLWITLQAHPNVVAVASLLELSAVIITEGAPISDDVIARADDEGIPLLATEQTSYWAAGELSRLGIRAQE